MAIKGNVGVGPIAVGTSDTTLLDAAVGDRVRSGVSAAWIHNDGSAAATVTIEIFVSPDLTSASGERVEYISVDDNKSIDISSIIGQGFSSTDNIIAKASATGSIAYLTIVEYTESS